jgi:hypothetical protein
MAKKKAKKVEEVVEVEATVEEVVEAPAPKPKAKAKSIDEMTTDELKALAADKGIKLARGLTHKEIIRKVRNA